MEIVSLTNIIAANPTLLIIKCLCKMYTEIDKIQRRVNSAYYSLIHIQENIIRTCQRHPALATNLTNLLSETSDMVNFLYNSIINYNTVHKPASIDNYVQSNHDWNNEMFFTNHQYWRNRPMYSQYRDTLSLLSRLFYWPGIFQHIKRYFVCRKISY